MKKILYVIAITFFFSFSYSNGQEVFNPTDHSVYKGNRDDGRHISSKAITHFMLKNLKPKYSFDPNMSLEEFNIWKKGFRDAMIDVMNHPKVTNQPSPKLLNTLQKDGYRVEKWELYPLENCVSTFLVLIPDNITELNTAPGIMCIPGHGGSKESLAGVDEIHPSFSSGRIFPNRSMAVHYVKNGMVAVAVDNPAVGETSDLEKFTTAPNYNYDAVARDLLEIGWSYLGYSSFIDMQILRWMKTAKYIDKDKIVLSGHSLGSEPMMVLGVLDTSVAAIVYSDFLCRTLERRIVLTEPYENGRRPQPNSIRHLIPGFLTNFDFPDIAAYFAPTPLICTEGGLDRDLMLVQKAYDITGHSENFTFYHYPKFSDPKVRGAFDSLPEGINSDTYFSMTNVDPPQHYFKYEIVIPWIKKLFDIKQ